MFLSHHNISLVMAVMLDIMCRPRGSLGYSRTLVQPYCHCTVATPAFHNYTEYLKNADLADIEPLLRNSRHCRYNHHRPVLHGKIMVLIWPVDHLDYPWVPTSIYPVLVGPSLSLLHAYPCIVAHSVFASWIFPLMMSSHLVLTRKNATLGIEVLGVFFHFHCRICLQMMNWEGWHSCVTSPFTFPCYKSCSQYHRLLPHAAGSCEAPLLTRVEAPLLLVVSWVLRQRFVSRNRSLCISSGQCSTSSGCGHCHCWTIRSAKVHPDVCW